MKSRNLTAPIPGEVRHPAIWFGALLLLVVVSRITEIIPGLSSFPLGDLAAGACVMFLLFGPRERLASFADAPTSKMALLFGIAAAASAVYSIWPGRSINFLLSTGIVSLLLYVTVLLTARTERDIRMYTHVLIVGAVGFTLRGLLSGISSSRLKVISAYDPNDLALFLIVVLPMVLAERALVESALRKRVLGGLAVGIVLVALLTQSRGGLLGLAFVCLYLVFFDGFQMKSDVVSAGEKIRRAVVLLIISVSIVFVLPEQAIERFSTISDVSSDYNVVSDREGRLAIWTRGLSYLVSHPWGAGVASYQAVDSMMGGQFLAPHNFLVQVAVEVGVLGFCFYLIVLWRTYRNLGQMTASLRSARSVENSPRIRVQYVYAHALRMALGAFAVAGFFLSAGYSSILLSVIAIATSLQRAHISSRELGASEAARGLPQEKVRRTNRSMK